MRILETARLDFFFSLYFAYSHDLRDFRDISICLNSIIAFQNGAVALERLRNDKGMVILQNGSNLSLIHI